MRLPLLFIFSVLALLTNPAHVLGIEPKSKELSIAVFKDKIRGGWAGKMIGVTYGFPSEFHYLGRINEDPIAWKPSQVAGAIDQDDLYVGMTFAEALDRLGLDATTEQLGEAFKDSKYKLWHANACARRLLANGIKAPMSGHPKYNIHANDIDFQIEADFIGLMCPGLPQASNEFCDRIGHVMNYGDGVYGGMFVSGMYSAAYFETDVRKVVQAGLACIPAKSEYAQLIQDVLKWHKENPNDWKKTWKMIDEKWDKEDSCIEGALAPFNIDAKINGGYVALGLLYGNGNFEKTLEVSTRAGHDSDCNPSTAAGVLGVMIGYSKIPTEWKSGIPAVANKKFSYTNSSLNDICNSTLSRSFQIIKKAGGTVSKQRVVIPQQAATPAKLEQWTMGTPVKRIHANDAELKWSGTWQESSRLHHKVKHAGTADAELTFEFEGTAVAIEGEVRPYGGMLEVYVDGKKDARIDTYAHKSIWDTGIWHAYGLKPGKHTVRLVVLGKSSKHSTGKDVTLSSVVIFK